MIIKIKRKEHYLITQLENPKPRRREAESRAQRARVRPTQKEKRKKKKKNPQLRGVWLRAAVREAERGACRK